MSYSWRRASLLEQMGQVQGGGLNLLPPEASKFPHGEENNYVYK